MLHTLHRSPWQCDFTGLLRTLSAGDDLLLLQDGVTAALRDSEYLPALQQNPADVYLLNEDILARGLHQHICPNFPRIGYPDFVRLVLAHPQQINW